MAPAALQNNPNLWNNAPAGFNAATAEVLDDPGLSDIHMSNEQGRSTWIWQFNWTDSKTVLSTIKTILGYSYTAGAALKRVTPMKHPLFPWMWAKEVSGWKPKGYTGKENLGRGQAAAWTRVELTVSYWIPPYAIMTDNVAITGEWQRYCERKWKPATKIISSDKAEYEFYNTPPLPGPPAYATKINQSVARQQMEGLYEYVWHEVPASFINSADENGFPNGPPTEILNGVNKVNSVEFNGFHPGTLLLESPDFHPFGQPIGETLGDPVDGTSPPLIYTVTLPMKHFDPFLGDNTGGSHESDAMGDYKVQGHNTRIHAASPSGLAYPIRTIAGQSPLYQGYDFANLFKKA